MSCWLLGWFAHNNKGKVPAGRQRQREAMVCYCACARKLSLLGGAWCCRWHSPAYNDPDSERSTVPLSPSLLPLASMQTLDAATFESRFQIREQILFQIPFNRNDPNIGESHWSLTAPAKLAILLGYAQYTYLPSKGIRG